jgi:hypothetical protein
MPPLQADFDEQHEDDELIDRIWNCQSATEGGNEYTANQKAERRGLQLRPEFRQEIGQKIHFVVPPGSDFRGQDSRQAGPQILGGWFHASG